MKVVLLLGGGVEDWMLNETRGFGLSNPERLVRFAELIEYVSTVQIPSLAMNKAALLLAALLICGCSRDRHQEALDMISSANNVSEELVLSVDPNFYDGQSRMPQSSGSDEGAMRSAITDARQVIRTGKYEYEVERLDSARERVLRVVKAHGGYVDGEELNDWSDRQALVFRLRIPSRSIEGAVAALSPLGRLKYQMLTSEDVTSTLVDIEARLRSKRELEQRYLELVARADKVNELLEIERALEGVRAEVESMDAQMRVMRDQVAMSTLNLTCSVPKKPSTGFWAEVGNGFGSGWQMLLQLLIGLVRIWPMILLLIGAIWIIGSRRLKAKARG